MERDEPAEEPTEEKRISTHTLTWSVTPLLFGTIKNISISTHTLTWSVTPNAAEVRQLKPISTHTLTWSVTRSP